MKSYALIALLLGGCGSGTLGNDGGSTDGGKGDLAVPGDALPADAATSPDLAQAGLNGYLGDTRGIVIQITIDHVAKTFQILAPQGGFTITGTAAAQPSGFQKLVVTAGCDGAGCMPSNAGSVKVQNGTSFHLVEAAGYFLAAMVDAGGGGFGAVARSNCEPGLFGSYNFVNVGLPPDYDLTRMPAYGTLVLGGTTAAVTLSGMSWAIDGSGATALPQVVTACSQGVLAPGNGATLYASSNGVLLVSDPNRTGAFATQGGAIALADLQNRTYSGIAFTNDMNGAAQPVSVTFTGGTTGIAKNFLDIDNNVVDPNGANWVNIDVAGVGGGLVTGTISGKANGPFKGVALKNGPQTALSLVIAIGTPGDGGIGGPTAVNVILISHG
jgi:hypothetical protein